ncbi:MAG: AAA family ATPase [Phycisphaerales bacterium]
MPTRPDDPLILEHWPGDVIETACSTVYLLGQRGYKIRKAVKLAYLDFSTLESRRHFSQEEVRLNAPLAPGVYQRVVPVVREADGTRRIADNGSPAGAPTVDFAVVMRRLPAEGMLAGVLGVRDLHDAEREAIVSRLAAFHAACAHGPDVAAHGSPERIRGEILTNLEQAAGLPGINEPVRSLVVESMSAQLARLELVLARRVREERIREGHGDLHAGNICFDSAARTIDNPTGLLIYDRLEFRMDFRCKDVAAELACLASTFDAHGRSRDGDRLVAEYARATGDPELSELQNLYRAHYSCVRAKVHALCAREQTGDADSARTHAAIARARMAQAAGYALPPSLVLTCGLPGSGKSFASRALGEALRAPIFRADEVRKELAGLRASDRGGPELYTPRQTERTYATVLERCAERLRARGGCSAIADATFRSRELRARFIALARSLGARVAIVHCRAGEDEIRRRLAQRAAEGADASDADISVFEKMRGSFEDPDPGEAPTVEMSPEVSTPYLVEQVVLALGRRGA